ncbi:hypothetical protein FKR81_20155 [Lentzea tibetensis]|uniref:Alkylhydroperoxidase family enzyme, contains CxxC motif n=1 Tax=Lentzea tibetensis TaxID=2591470 RepID=A0A563ES57_9PSEU|nr:hypothetical protein [Lentzea tibetensis]TWP50490.1 hypothetical protein FKR81_20155 [Lentzea tibetensis]
MDKGFLERPRASAEAQRLYDADVERVGFVMNLSLLWAHEPTLHSGLFDLFERAAKAGGLTFRQRSVLVAACASVMGDAYCSLAWGNRLASVAGADVAGRVLRGEDDQLDADDRVLAEWARKLARDPNATAAGDVQALRDAGYDDGQIFGITTFVALRIAFATINDSLGAQPDHELLLAAPDPVLEAVTYGRACG